MHRDLSLAGYHAECFAHDAKPFVLSRKAGMTRRDARHHEIDWEPRVWILTSIHQSAPMHRQLARDVFNSVAHQSTMNIVHTHRSSHAAFPPAVHALTCHTRTSPEILATHARTNRRLMAASHSKRTHSTTEQVHPGLSLWFLIDIFGQRDHTVCFLPRTV